MAGEGNRLLELIEYIKDCGIELNVGKTKAQGNKGFFKVRNNKFRIDIAKNLPEEVILSTLTHEFAHYIHYCHDKSLKSLDFLFEDISSIENELLQITVDLIPKSFAEELFSKKEQLKSEKKRLQTMLSSQFPNYNLEEIEKRVKKSHLKYLLRYDKIKIIENFREKLYSTDSLSNNSDVELYLKIKSKQRAINRINSKISSLNRYYNSPTELFARSFELFINNEDKLKKIAPHLYQNYLEIISTNKLPIMTKFFNICNKTY